MIDPVEIQFPILNLPPFQTKIKEENGKLMILDSLRKKYLVLTPEEWVRQHWINYLIEGMAYPKGLLSLERGLKYNQLSKRTDLVVFDREGETFLLVECKAPSVKINQNTLIQALTYNKPLNCPHIILSNGFQHICMSFDESKGEFVQKSTIPKAP
ncbi:type I restriction enzyme HsdR N-terminal domain-containing protein [Algoriphagus taiwanensis]|uniref:Type I restriction enzyme HsdR N-terminal domain-containing protein n=1 Tax=Algoriphagus taiwanensis TaxID=1445656 RepID=A0ABQ6PYJ8_9BACT|nr:type I restriction enzyme HsdR N-terminal domain-containing protein [Algoriphagus taiwanensis]